MLKAVSSLTHFDSILHPLKVGIWQKCIEKKFTIQALKKFPPIFVVGLLMKILGPTNFKKKSQKREFS